MFRSPLPRMRSVLSRRYSSFVHASNNIGGLDTRQLYQLQLYCQCILASQRHKLVVNDLEDDYFRPSILPDIPEDFPILNVTAIRQPEPIYTRHLADGLSLIPTIEALVRQKMSKDDPRSPADVPLRIVDIGSGGGIPGLILAIARPNWEVVTVDSIAKKCAFMKHVIDYIGISNAGTIPGRAEALAVPNAILPLLSVDSQPRSAAQRADDVLRFTQGLAGKPSRYDALINAPSHASHAPVDIPSSVSLFEGADVVVARGVTAMPQLLDFCAPFARPGGWFVAQKAAQVAKVLEDPVSSDAIPGAAPANKGAAVREAAKQHAADTPAFLQAVAALAGAPFTPAGDASLPVDNVNHEIVEARPLLAAHGLSPYAFVNCEPFFAGPLEAAPAGQPEDAALEQVRFLAIMEKLRSVPPRAGAGAGPGAGKASAGGRPDGRGRGRGRR